MASVVVSTARPRGYLLGLTATAYHLLGVYGGVVLALASAFGPDHSFTGAAAHNGHPASDQVAS